MLKFRELLAAGGFAQRTGTSNQSSFTGLTVSSAFTGNATIRGFGTINSGTTIASISATGVVSGDIIMTGIIQYASGVSSQAMVNTYVESVRAGAFEIRCVGSVAPVGNMPVGWFRIN